MRILRLDGLRAVAVVAVILHHHEILRGGWVGVDLFFVLSGFLITGILRRDRKQDGYWRHFYTKRATRILPPLLLLIAVTAIRHHPPVHSVLAYIFFMGNFANVYMRWRIPTLGMVWSLAVEEHFYLLFPFAVRFLDRTTLFRLLAAVLMIEPLLRLLATPFLSSYMPIYYWTFFRLDPLAWGCLLALWMENERAAAWIERFSGWCALAGAGLFSVLSYTLPTLFDREANSRLFNTLGYSLLGLVCVAVLAWVLLHAEVWPSRILASRSFVFLGSISYGLYLYHEFFHMAAMRATGLGPRASFLVAAPIVVLFSWISFRFYETPLIRWGHRSRA